MNGLRAKGLRGEDVVLGGSEIERLIKEVAGEVILEGDPEYDDARKVWNRMIDRRPAVIVRCAGAEDVASCVRFVRDHGLFVSVRGGGHNVSGNAVNEGGFVIDLSMMRGVRVADDRRTVRVEGGARLGDVDNETQKFGLATPLGVVPETGVAGLTLHGGIGWLLRHYGTAADNIVSAEIVTADGRLRHASADEDPDLLWALRGGGGNFGVVTAFNLRLHKVGPGVQVGLFAYSLDDIEDVLRGFSDLMARAPDELTANILLWTTPPLPSVPEEAVGRPSMMVIACYSGKEGEGEAYLSALGALAQPLTRLSTVMRFLELQDLPKTFGLPESGATRHYWKSIYLKDLGPEVQDILRSATLSRPSDVSEITIYTLGGAFARVSAEEAAFDNRDERFLIAIEADWTEPSDDEANIEWARHTFEAIRKISQARVYLNFAGFAEEKDLVETSYAENMERLREIKAKYDPENLFRGHLNIRPSIKAIEPIPAPR